MANKIIVGTDQCSIENIVLIMKSDKFLSLVSKKWKQIAMDLGIPDHQKEDWKLDKNLGKTSLEEIIFDMVQTWVAGKGSEASLDDLQDAVTKNGLKNLSEALHREFQVKPESSGASLINIDSKLANAQRMLCSEETLAMIINRAKIVFDFEANDELTFPEKAIPLPKENRGCALLLNIHEFKNAKGELSYREGSLEDTEQLNEFFNAFGYETFPAPEIQQKESKTKKEVLKILDKFLNFSKKKNAQSVFVFIGSHGSHPNKIRTSDRRSIDIYKEIVAKFYNSAECAKHLEGKPKMFLVQACQGFKKDRAGSDDDDDEDDDDEVPTKKIKLDISNTIICFSTHPGGKAKRKLKGGTYFLQCFMWAMKILVKEGVPYHKILESVVKMTTEYNKEKEYKIQVPHCVPFDMEDLYFKV